MSDKNKSTACYGTIIKKIDQIEEQISSLKKTLIEITSSLSAQDEEVCPDVEASDKAVVAALEEICLNMLAETDPHGDA